ncbi:putative receptor like protein 25 [Papaver somniferum]|uniref:putative receptor like protein 25 n=1 Tax=Papaver somniferum TaxID=3469 RepID=UPI000E6F79B0|nr:putative receptor like protein 25 [Papaver somniferum]
MVIKGTTIQFKSLHSYSSGIDLSCNILEGNIPEGIGLLKGVSMLNLSHNRLSGRIPHKVGYMTGLDTLDLSFNKLSGEIPKSLTSIDSLGYFNLSNNNLSGRIPRGTHFDTLSLDGSAFAGNNLLCGFPTRNSCKSEQNVAKDSEEDDQEDASEVEDAKEKFLFYSIVALGFVAGFWGLFFILLPRKQKWWFGYWRLVDSVAIIIARYMQRN